MTTSPNLTVKKTFQIKNISSDTVLFEGKFASFKLCVEAAVKSGLSLTGADLRSVYLRSADLRSANLTGADLRSANLPGADLMNADLMNADLRSVGLRGTKLADADLRGANLRGADLRGADLRGANMRDTDLRGADLRSVDLTVTPAIEGLFTKVLAAINIAGNALSMVSWHTCETTHCLAGWIITLAGKEGLVLERSIGTGPAAALITIASHPNLDRVPNWYATNEDVMNEIKLLATLEETT